LKIPSLPHRHFLVLSALIDGADKTFEEIRRDVGWSVSQSGFTATVGQLQRRGLAVRVRFPGPVPHRIRHRDRKLYSAFRITDCGLEAWAETLDFYRFFGERHVQLERAKCQEQHETPKSKPGAQIAPFITQSREPERRPTADETERLLSFASPEFACFYRAFRCDVVSLKQLAALQIRDVDLSVGALRVASEKGRNYTVRVDDTFFEIVETAIGDRNEGPAFVTVTGRAWTPAVGRHWFTVYRRAAGLPLSIAFRGRLKRKDRPQRSVGSCR